MNIARHNFIDAIEAGIENAPNLTESEREALREVGRTAEVVGLRFSTGCPVILAGVTTLEVVDQGQTSSTVWAFVTGYDRYLWRTNRPGFLHDDMMRVVA